MKTISRIGVVLFAALLPVMAQACLVEYSVTVTANYGGQSFTETFDGQGLTDEKGFLSYDILNGATTNIGLSDSLIEKLILNINADPEVGIEFGVRAGSLNTTFSIVSELVTFAPIVNPEAYASAGITLTDRGSSAAGATITGLFDGKTHQARYNSTSVFGNLVNGFSIPNGTLTSSEDLPFSGTSVINDTVSSIESEFYFSLTARDSASGTSTFVVIPEPATICILALGTLSLFGRRK